MLFNLVKEAILRRKRRTLLTFLAVSLGVALASALLTVSLGLTERMAKEMRSYGANILVTPRSQNLQVEIGGVSYSPTAGQELLDEREMVKVKSIFWRNNILGLTPFLDAMVTVGEQGQQTVLTGTWFERTLHIPVGATVRSTFAGNTPTSKEEHFGTGARPLSPWWQVQGDWPEEGSTKDSLVGVALARRLGIGVGDTFNVRRGDMVETLRVAGLLQTGGLEEERVFVHLPVAQALAGVEYGASRVMVSALALPKEKLAPDIREKKPEEMTPKEYEKWYCSPILDAIITQIKEVLPSAEVSAIRQISESEGAFILRLQRLMVLLTGVALAAALIGVMTTVTVTVRERAGEVGLMKALGADNAQVATIFLVETGLIGLAGGLAGYLSGFWLADLAGRRVFSTPAEFNLSVLPVAVVLGVGVALTGSLPPVRWALKLQPVRLLREG
ncbi:MAG: ABC transporter permease [Chloroflexi bacterium]|nr:ABC transporter permease [Chloroflexota bacterium]